MSPAVAAISKLAIVKTSSIAHTPLFHPHTRTLKFLHQKIRIKQEDRKMIKPTSMSALQTFFSWEEPSPSLLSIDEAQEVPPRNVAEGANKPHCCLLQPREY